MRRLRLSGERWPRLAERTWNAPTEYGLKRAWRPIELIYSVATAQRLSSPFMFAEASPEDAGSWVASFPCRSLGSVSRRRLLMDHVPGCLTNVSTP